MFGSDTTVIRGHKYVITGEPAMVLYYRVASDTTVISEHKYVITREPATVLY